MENIKEEKAREYEIRARAYLEAMTLKIDIDSISTISQHECNKAYYHYNIGYQVGFEAGKQERDRTWISSEAKPQFDGYYLCFILYPQECGNIWKRQEVVYLHFNAWQLNDRSGTITHWQNLPEPPIENLSK